MSTESMLDVAIVGGGVSGVYSAYRLAQADVKKSALLGKWADGRADKKLKIAVFEGSDRIGGRLLSVTPPGMPHVRCELGGMRYLSTQKWVRSLIENKLKLATKPFPVAEPKNLAYLRRKRLRLSDLGDPTKVPYDVDWAERGQSPDKLLGYAIDQIVPGFTSLKAEEMYPFLQSFKFEGKPLYEYGFWNLLARALTFEAYSLALETSGYDTIGLNWNAVDTIMLNFGDFGPQIKYKSLVDGYETVPTTLRKLFADGGGTVTMNSWLKSFENAKLPDGSMGLALHFRGDAAPKTVLARSLVLAMPRRSLELLDQTGPLFDPSTPAEKTKVRNLIQSVTPIPLFKMFICYPIPWWKTLGVSQGQSVTDLPVRQCYYWAVEGEQPGADPKNTNSVLLGTYDDTLNVDYWAGLRGSPDLHSYVPGTNRFVDQHGIPPDDRWAGHKASKPMADEVHRQLQEIHGLKFVPNYYSAAFRDWGDDPFGGGVNFWNINAKSWEVIPQMVHPIDNVPVYICGEAYSNGQGWVEGALQTAEMMLSNYFGLPDPDWLTDQPVDSSAPTPRHGLLR